MKDIKNDQTMNKRYQSRNIAICFLLAVIAFYSTACKRQVDDYGLRSDYAVYTTMTPTPLDAPTVAITGAGAQSVPNVSFRVYVNLLYDTAVVVKFTLTGTAVAGTHYTYTGDYSVTIPPRTRYVDVPVTVINNSLGASASRTIILTLVEASGNFEVGIGSANGFSKSTYTIRKS